MGGVRPPVGVQSRCEASAGPGRARQTLRPPRRLAAARRSRGSARKAPCLGPARRAAAIGYMFLGFRRVVAAIARQAREMGRWDVPKRRSANVQAGELEFRHEPGRRLAVLVMVMGA